MFVEFQQLFYETYSFLLLKRKKISPFKSWSPRGILELNSRIVDCPVASSAGCLDRLLFAYIVTIGYL